MKCLTCNPELDHIIEGYDVTQVKFILYECSQEYCRERYLYFNNDLVRYLTKKSQNNYIHEESNNT